MSTAVAAAPVQRATILATLEKARRRGGTARVLGIRASRGLESAEGLTDQHGEPVTVLWCASALAVWDALSSWDESGWLVLLTDRSEDELGSGLLARFAQHRLHRPDAWESVKLRFRATGLDRALLKDSAGTGGEIPEALLRIEPQAGWPAARAGVLSRDTAYGAVARRRLDIETEILDGPAVLEATLDPSLPTHLANLRRDGGDALTDAVLDWLVGRLGAGAVPARHVLASGSTGELLPLGLALAQVVGASGALAQEAALAGARLEARLPDALRGATLPSAAGPAAEQVRSLAAAASLTIHGMLSRPTQRDAALAVLRRTESILRAEQAPSLIAGSELLPGGLAARRRTLAAALGTDPAMVEQTWRAIQEHPLTVASRDRDPLHAALHAAVRLDRWLATSEVPAPDSGVGRLERVVTAARTHAHDGAWAESALGDLHQGSDDPEIATTLEALAERLLERRRALDRAFAQDLAPLAQGEPLPASGDVHYMEDVLGRVGLPLARSTPVAHSPRRGGVLVLLVDGMSAAAATDLTRSILDVSDAWREIVPAGTPERATALALLPSLTTHSRTSFFAGAPVSGGQQQERTGLAALARDAGLRGTALFHKDDLVRKDAGSALTNHVASAIADVVGTPLVGCVLNTIDDALDKSDPGGTRWSTADIQYLRPLLQEAARAGRTVLLTADHGHVVERHGRLQRHEGTTSARSRAADGDLAGPDEIRVEGPRVLGGGSAILAVDEDLRYSDRKAGYHGGASLAELVVPVIALRPRPVEDTEQAWADGLPEGWMFTSDQRPLWWSTRSRTALQIDEPVLTIAPSAAMLDIYGTDQPEAEPITASGLGAAIIDSPRYADQKKVLRRTPSDETVAALVDELAAAPGTRLPFSRVSQLLVTPLARTSRTVGVVAQLLNVEGFEVLRLEEETAILDVTLARQQFEVSR